MLIIYDAATGEVLDNTGTSSVMPEGPTGALMYVNTDARGLTRAGLGLLRLHDEKDAELVQQVLRNFHRVDPDTKQVVIEGPYPTLAPNRATIPADGTTPAVITYRSGRAPAQTTFDVNGVTVTEPVVDGTASIEVVTAQPGPITITCEGLQATITAEA